MPIEALAVIRSMLLLVFRGVLILICAAASALAAPPAEQAAEFFELHIRPVLAGTCFKCHGGESTSGGLRVDSRDALVAGGERGPAIVPGHPQESLLVRALSHADESVQMPPDAPLAANSVTAFSTWIESGAEWPAGSSGTPFESTQHWAFRPLVDAELSVANERDLAAQPIDRFLRQRQRQENVTPIGPADRASLLRRAYFDLIGLPPTPEELAKFLADDAPDAFAREVERLLASPQYGERWGRHWLDVVRYADTAGDNADYPVPEARLYRDYVIDSFNSDKPYDEFIREQLAGDLIAAQHPDDRQHYAERIIATGYLALSRRFATAPYELWHLTLEDTVDTTGRAFLGLTLRCARCHDHKFDPVTQEDYYALYGIFESTQFPWAGGEEFQSKKTPRQHFAALVPPSEAVPQVAAMTAAIEKLSAELAAAEKADNKPRVEALRDELAPWQNAQKLDAPQGVPVAYAVRDGQPADAYVHLRGEPENRGPVVPRGVPKFLAGETPLTIPLGTSGRLELANWLSRSDHPLTARVIANRVWQWHFGRGLVTTPSNFGMRGATPDHPELLDWLARRLIDGDWSIKALHREIMASETYQLASSGHAENASRDPDNRFYWRFDRRRLDAEAIRDAILAVSGTLDTNRPGTQPFPPVSKWHWTQHSPFKASYPSNHRSVYLMTQRIQRHPYLALFDGPDTNMSTDIRTSATVPSQALFLMNNPFVSEQAVALADRLIAFSPEVNKRIELAGRLCWSRELAQTEVETATQDLAEVRAELERTGTPAAQLEREVWTIYARVLLASNELVYVD
jgi:cytochrome c553